MVGLTSVALNANIIFVFLGYLRTINIRSVMSSYIQDSRGSYIIVALCAVRRIDIEYNMSLAAYTTQVMDMGWTDFTSGRGGYIPWA